MCAKDQAARRIAAEHAELEPGLVRVFRFRATPEQEADPREPIKLLTVNENMMGIGALPVFFGPDAQIEYPSAIVELTPDEYEKFIAGQFALPEGWRLAEMLFERKSIAVPS